MSLCKAQQQNLFFWIKKDKENSPQNIFQTKLMEKSKTN
jgi:hypothetical protein